MTPAQERQLDYLLDVESGLQSRELDFIEDLDQRWRERGLSEKQTDWLNKIYERVVWR